MATIEIESPYPIEDTVERLLAFGREWRESKIPPEVRRRGVFGCTVMIKGNDLYVDLVPRRQEPVMAWTCQVLPREERQSLVVLASGMKKQGFIFYGVLLVGVFVWGTIQPWFGSGGMIENAIYMLFVVTVLFVYIAGLSKFVAERQRKNLHAILAYVLKPDGV
jgi:hypothetical protein